MNVRIFPVILLLIFVEFGFSQSPTIDPNSPCGTGDLSTYFAQMNFSSSDIQLRSSTTSYFPLNVVSVGNDQGQGHLDPVTIRSSLCALNQDFEFLDVQFYIKDEIKYLNRTSYYDHDKNSGFEMMRNNNDRNAFNVYIVDNPDSTCGYFNQTNPAIAIAKNCFEGGLHALTHEMGHYLGLPHTFFGWENLTYNQTRVPRTLSIRGSDTLYTERVSGQYCDKASDGFCDTPPDYLGFRWSCDRDGYSLDTYVDPDGVEFKVDGRNFMSYSLNSCQETFSTEQSNKMLVNLLDSRNGLYSGLKYQFVADELVSGENIVPIAPAQDAEVNYLNVRLQWEALAGSTEYYVEISRFPGILFNEDPNKITLVSTNSFVDVGANNLLLDTKYYWKVYPLNPFTLCPVSSTEQKFTTRTQTNTQQFSNGEKVTIFPNVLSGQDRNINIQYMVQQAKTFHIDLIDLQGKVVLSQDSHILGDTTEPFQLPNLTAGMYFFKFSNGQDYLIQKIIIQ
ncbi:T9SS type A sorting domain-containing protein [Membranihabitans marinus]|uniref:T9SS type A sorting domain-containing protein n=1 Tax=Membranihabitans marinus TaxID=1227546 RepID=UPI001F2CC8D9|nr:T9SS type A sorting domain-containing protein [Membranihabitans marinus]